MRLQASFFFIFFISSSQPLGPNCKVGLFREAFSNPVFSSTFWTKKEKEKKKRDFAFILNCLPNNFLRTASEGLFDLTLLSLSQLQPGGPHAKLASSAVLLTAPVTTTYVRTKPAQFLISLPCFTTHGHQQMNDIHICFSPVPIHVSVSSTTIRLSHLPL